LERAELTQQMTDLFASYAWGPPDAEGARPLQRKAHAIVARQRGAGFSVWLDADYMSHDASGGASGIPEAMAKAIITPELPPIMAPTATNSPVIRASSMPVRRVFISLFSLR
jgi:hypothetical protein